MYSLMTLQAHYPLTGCATIPQARRKSKRNVSLNAASENNSQGLCSPHHAPPLPRSHSSLSRHRGLLEGFLPQAPFLELSMFSVLFYIPGFIRDVN
ncbi:hypothetical protein E2C01_095785 [Portunus trituberculatus]|uniref:Uncharacterized protein n=1 Tax=Portunus trituberculatus TaxID=210409 RepID=A0A5B7JTX3_PORTR|nr:hypothetical protein [Portunus trituberculatus]